MKFSELNRKSGKAAAAGPRAQEKAEPKPSFTGAFSHGTEEPAGPALNPLDAPIPDFFRPPAAAPPAPVPAGAPAPAASSRKEQQRRNAAAGRAAAPPFAELDEQAGKVYAANLTLARELITRIDRPYIEKYERIMRQAERNSRVLSENPVLVSHTRRATADDYLYAHSANVAILSQALGLALGLETGAVDFLGFCALAHDIGMTGHSGPAGKEYRLSDEEYAGIVLHSENGAAKIDRFLDMDPHLKEQAREIILQVHERIDGSGYPRRLANGEIGFPARIISIADVYEAMTHPRAWRAAGHPHNVMKHLIDKEGKGFDSRVVKALIETLSLYPPGSLVALSSGEIAAVARTNKGALTRPAVSVLLDPDFNPVTPRLVDLLEHPLTGIERIVEDEELSARNPKFAAKLELARWWVDW